MSEATLLDVFTVHCFWGWCDHTVQDFDSEAASRKMQAHYDEKHQDDLARLGYGAKGGRWWAR